MIFSNGDTYLGEFNNNKISGKGTYTWADKSQFVGGFVDGMIHGNGEISYSFGVKG